MTDLVERVIASVMAWTRAEEGGVVGLNVTEAKAGVRALLAERDARIAELEGAMREIQHSIQQARILGNDWRRELALIENIARTTLASDGQSK